MSEQFPESGTRRGRRSAELEVALEAEENEPTSMIEHAVLNEGDSVMCRVSMAHPTAAGDGWFSFGATTTVRPGEDVDGAAERLYEATTSNLYDLIDGVTETVTEAVEAQKEAEKANRRARRIPSGSDR